MRVCVRVRNEQFCANNSDSKYNNKHPRTHINKHRHTHAECNICVCLWQQQQRQLIALLNVTAFCTAPPPHLASVLLPPTLFPPSLFHLLLCRCATFFTFLAAFTKQAGNISVINIGLAALPSSSGAISYPGSAWVSLFLSSSRSCSQFAFVSLSRGSGINVIVVCACKTPADCRRLPTYNTNTNRRHTCTHTHALIYSHSHTNRITGALSQAPTHALFASAHSLALSLSLSSLSLMAFWESRFAGHFLRPLLPAAVVSRWRCLRQKEVVARPPAAKES